MKLYYIGPIVPAGTDAAGQEARLTEVVEPIARLVHGYLQRDSYAGLVGLRHENEIGEAPSVPVSKVGEWRLRHFETEAEVLAALMNMGDPFVPTDFFTIRSMISCRAVMYGYDAQAFLCLRTEDEAPASPDPSLILVEERPDLLLQTDYLDGAEAALDDDARGRGSPRPAAPGSAGASSR